MRKIAAIIACMVLTTAGGAWGAVGGGEVTLKNKGGEVVFSHETHVDGVQLQCTQCHDKPYLLSKQHTPVSMKQMQKGKSCGLCHNGKQAFSVKSNCAKCHKK